MSNPACWSIRKHERTRVKDMATTSNDTIQGRSGFGDPFAPSTSDQSRVKNALMNWAQNSSTPVGSQRFALAIEQAKHTMSLAPWLQYSSNPELEQAAAEWQLKHQISAALDQGFVLHDPCFPEFSRLDKHNQFGLVNPDNLYFLASIETPGTYIIYGKRGTSADLQIQVGAGEPGFDDDLTSPIPVSELDLGALSVKRNGEFTILISDTEPCDLKTGENWLCNTIVTPKGKLCANSVLIRESLMDWDTETGGTWRIERIDTVGKPNPLPTPARVDLQYERAANYLTGSTKGWIKFVEQLRVNLPANHISPARKTGQGLPGQFNSAGHFQMSDDTAIVITVDESDARYQGIQLGDLWFNALDFRRRQTSLTTKQAYQSEDGKYRFVISAKDPGFENWLDPAGASTVFVFMRWQGIPHCPGEEPKAPNNPQRQVLTFDQLGEKLKCEPDFSPEQRKEQLAARHVSALNIPRGF
ncbi:hypothetical protein [Tateyamaria omphalii]|uniref:DUF1214 domain-containing protein n=1 Tax=Tateyamaria omphalii TaxID=299262 RepID=A0A1P8MXJ2_9RHOB|nr:hypothetical protein [Tateyamaria omphalii]APX12805.1 hypothetical protein BWR18_14755 [Tateyamaria omphalii]